MTRAPLTPEEIRKRQAVLQANPGLVRTKERANRASVRVGKVEWPRVGAPVPPSVGGGVRHMPVEKHMLSERAWLLLRPLGEKA